MSLTFVNPYFLFGLAAGILPILIHRLIQKKAIPKTFSAVRLLLRSQRMTARPQRLKHLLLLCLRVLGVMSLVFLMARPVLTQQGLLASGIRGAKIIILDNSLSMGYREENGENRFQIAKKAAEEVIKDLKGQVILIPTAATLNARSSNGEARWMGPEEALKQLSSISLSFGRGDPVSAMDKAHGKLKELKTEREILIISDLTRGDWEGFNPSKLSFSPYEVPTTLLRIGGPKRDSNLGIKRVALVEGDGVVGVPGRMEVTASNLSDRSQSTLVELYLSGVKIDQKSMEVKGGEDGKVSFELFLDRPGWVNGEVRLSGDRLSVDDVFYFPLKVREKIKVLIVDGDPRTSLRSSESYYVVNALHPGGLERSPFLTRVVTEEGLIHTDLKSYEALLLLNVSRPQASRLSSFLESSKPVFIFLGDRVVREEYNNIPLFPWRIQERVDRQEKIARIDERHDSLRPFSGADGGSLRNASIRRYFKIEGSKSNLITLENRDPLLVEADLGKGKLFLYTSTADLDWNDLPLKAAYLPLIQGLLKEAAGLTKSSFPPGIKFGEPFEEKAPFHQLTGPQGGPGIYQFVLPSGEARRSINVPPEESDLGKISDTEIKKRFGTADVRVVEYNESIMGRLQGGRKEIWPLILGFLLVVLAVEMGLASKI
jgi:Aerotolerance regulator N-terminal